MVDPTATFFRAVTRTWSLHRGTTSLNTFLTTASSSVVLSDAIPFRIASFRAPVKLIQNIPSSAPVVLGPAPFRVYARHGKLPEKFPLVVRHQTANHGCTPPKRSHESEV